jgi:hypothetical protein
MGLSCHHPPWATFWPCGSANLTMDASKQKNVATEILLFDFEVTYQYVVEGSKERC